MAGSKMSIGRKLGVRVRLVRCRLIRIRFIISRILSRKRSWMRKLGIRKAMIKILAKYNNI
jgi:hypothetical protein